MNYSRCAILLIFCLLAILVSGCFNTRFLKKNEKLFQKNIIDFHSTEPNIKDRHLLKRELRELSQLQPNQRLFGLFKTRLWFYNVANRPKETKFSYWMKNKIGEAPVLFDSTLAYRSTVMMTNYLINKGFFYAQVNYTALLRKRKASVLYQVYAGPRYHIGQVEFDRGSNAEVNQLLIQHAGETLLLPGNPFDVNILKKERERISDHMKEAGYYLFNRDMVYFNIDSQARHRQLQLTVTISQPLDSADHRKFYINNVYIHTNFSFEQFSDTTLTYDTLRKGAYFFIYPDELYIKPLTILTCIYFRRGDVYKRSDVQKTIVNLTDLGIFRFINVKFEELIQDSINLLNCHFYLTPAKKQAITTTFEVNNNTYNLMGINIDLGYTNRNLLRGAERFQFDITAGAETNFDTDIFFNTTDLSAASSLLFNKFLIPFRIKNLAKTTRPKTRVGLKFNYLTRVQNFSIFSGSASYGYEWRKNNFRHQLNIMNISFVRAPENRQSDEFRQLLITSPSLRNSFSEQLIVGINHSLTWNKKIEKDTRNQLFIRINNELAGNLLNGISALAHISRQEQRPYRILGISYAQYYKAEAEFRHYFDLSKDNRWANRFFMGIGIPYANSHVLPYVKQYFSGGSVSLRAWPVRSLGPGSYQYTPGRFNDQTGDVKIELNSEIRFTLIKFIKGALFADAGNIWLSRADSTRPGAEFSLKRFYKEIALGSGVGIRMDLSYFVLRFDIGFRLFDPTRSPGEKWVVRDISFRQEQWFRKFFTFNLALGYPF